jgi:hypothetical protein
MKDKIQTIDNFLKPEVFNAIKHELTCPQFSWYLGDQNQNEDMDDFYFFHWLWADNKQLSPYFNQVLMPILSRLNHNYLLRSKINLYPRNLKPKPSIFHVDVDTPHTVAILSLNTCNGYTLFKDKTKIYSVENQLILFDGQLEHASVAASDVKTRININIDIV